MNHIYRTVFNRALGVWQVVAEIAGAQGKGRSAGRSGRGGLRLPVLLPLSVWASLAWAVAPAPTANGTASMATTAAQAAQRLAGKLPTGGKVSAGNGSIASSGTAMTITQNTQHLAINWQTFDIGENASVTFLQPNATAIALNRVLGSEGSQILGQLKGNGQVWVLNPNGVLFGSNAQVDVGGLVASSLGLSDADFMAGNYRFSGSGGSVINQGSLSGGYVALLGESVRNEGVIAARLGTAALAAGNAITLDFNGDALLNVQVDEGALHALADNRGLIQADGGTVLMTARAKDALLDTAVNNTGVIRARTVENRNGRILLLGDMDSGSANIAGTLDASAPDGGNGGFIETSAAHVKVADGAVITTKAANGQSGTWLIDPNDFTIAASGGNMTGAAVGNALDNNGNFIIQTATMGTAGGSGDINVNDAVTWNSNSTLTLQAERSVNVNAAITATGSGAGLAVDYNQGSGITDGNFYVNATVNLPVTGSLAINGQNYTLITSLAGLNNPNGHYALVQDSSDAITAMQGNLTGTLEGLGHTVSGININDTSVNTYVGLFNTLQQGSMVRNLNIDGSVSGRGEVGLLAALNLGSVVNVHAGGSVTATNGTAGGLIAVNGTSPGSGDLVGVIEGSSSSATVTTNSGNTAGGLVGVNYDSGTIRNSYATGDATSAGYLGGLVGGNTGIITHSYATGKVTATSTYAGGLVGYNEGTIDHSYATGPVTGGSWVGGLVGYETGTVDSSYATGAVSGSSRVGGLVGGVAAGAAVTNSYWDTYTTGQSNAVGAGVSSGTTAVTSDPSQSAAANYTFKQSAYADFDFGSDWFMVEGSSRPMLRAFLNEADSNGLIAVTNLYQLQGMAANLASHYLLTQDIDASATAPSGNLADVWGGRGFATIGGTAAPFTGSVHGQGHSIDGLHILRGSNNNIGLFGFIENATLQDFNLTNATIEGFNYVGALAGYAMRSQINNVAVSGSVTGNQYVGGMVGYGADVQIDTASSAGSVRGNTVVGGLLGDSASSTILRNSQSSATVSGTSHYVGGLAGRIGVGGRVEQSQASGTVSVAQDVMHSVGGLVGENNGSITASSASGTVQGGRIMGGLVGNNNGSIASSHATGNVTGLGALGGLVGENHGSIDDSHAEGAVSGQGGVGGLAGETYGAISNSHATGNVTATVDYAGGLVGYSGSAAGTITNSYATGEVKGQNRVGGLVGEAQATISNSYAQGTVSGSGVMGYVGGLAGYTAAAINSSHATGNVTYTGNGDYVGGLAGKADAAITNSYASGDVDSTGANVGGLAGGTSGSNVSHSYASGNVTGSGNYVGGLLGSATNGSTIGNSYASGDVSGASMVGGLAGHVVGGNVSHSHASGNVTGSGVRVGGLLGSAVNGSAVGNSYATGNASGGQYVGGLVGLTGESSISNSYATGNATSTGDDAGGLVGDNGSTGISNSYASGDVSGVSRVGGLVGNNTDPAVSFSSDITNSYANGRVTGSGSDIGGLVGKNREFNPHYLEWYDAGTITGSFWNLDTSGQSSSAGGGTGLTTAQMQQLSTFVDAGWDISDQGGDGKVWRIYEGSTTPLLRSFMQQLTVTVPAGGTDKTYDGQIASGTLAGYTTSTPADVNLLLGTLGYATTGANAGTYSTANGTLQLGGLHSTQQGYDISYAGNSSLTINKAALTVTANNASKTYDATAWSGGNGVSYSGFVNGENDTVLGGTLVYGGNSQGAVNAGNYLISAGGLSSGNYAINYVDGTLTIDPRQLSAMVGSLTGTVRKTYDGSTNATLDAGNFLITGWAGNDGATITQTSGQYDNANAGSGKHVTVNLTLADYLAANGTDLANYVLPTQISGNVGIIDKADATVTANSGTVTYNGQVQSVAGYTITGLVNGEDESVLDSVVTTGGSGRNAGSYAHSVSGSDNNYALTFIDGTLTIDKAALALGTADVTRTYDGTTHADGNAIVIGGQLFGDDAISGGSFAFTDRNAGTGKTVTVDGVTVDDGNGGGNYTVTYIANTTSTILQKALTIGGDFNAEDKLHDGNDRATISRNALALQGVVAGDALTVDWQAAFTDAAIGPNKTVTLRGTSLAGGDSGNYLLDLEGAPTAIASIWGTPIGTAGRRYASATRSAKPGDAWQPRHSPAVPAISVQQCGQNLPSQLVRDCQ